MGTKLEDGQSLLFIGDSITDCGRRDDRGRPLGLGYVRMVHDLLIGREPEKQIKVINRGIGGNTIEDLRSRWADDVIAYKPDWLSIKIGINDANRHLCSENQNYMPPAEFRDIYIQLLEMTQKAMPGIELLLITPFFISRDQTEGSYRKKVLEILPEYIKVVEEMSRKFGTRLINLHDIFQKILDHRLAEDLCPEPVHPHSTGHLVMAEAVYRALCQ
ncbi:MAG: SGNH/GDSL hydrolase family protein [Candidatus Sumerlaeia bacterium]